LTGNDNGRHGRFKARNVFLSALAREAVSINSRPGTQRMQETENLETGKNCLKEIRESLLMSKSELARTAHVSPITISRIEKGMACRMETKRKIILALGFKLKDKDKIFND
jgi:DNA-binding XRE family transcriptional regulator